MKITVFGSSSKSTPQLYRDEAFKLGQLIAAEGHTCINGGTIESAMNIASPGARICLICHYIIGGRFGVMGSLSEGARDKDGKIIGIIHEKFCVDGEEDGETKTMIISRGPDLTERKQLLYDNGDCIIVLPGGVGTFDELWESICSKSLNMKGLGMKPICIVNLDGFYDGSIIQLKRAFNDQLLYLPLEKYVHVASTVEEALYWSVDAYKSSLVVPYEDISSSRKSAKVIKGEEPSADKLHIAAIQLLESDVDDKIPPKDEEVVTEKIILSERNENQQSSSRILVPMASLSVGLIIGYTLARWLK